MSKFSTSVYVSGRIALIKPNCLIKPNIEIVMLLEQICLGILVTVYFFSTGSYPPHKEIYARFSKTTSLVIY